MLILGLIHLRLYDRQNDLADVCVAPSRACRDGRSASNTAAPDAEKTE